MINLKTAKVLGIERNWFREEGLSEAKPLFAFADVVLWRKRHKTRLTNVITILE
jgi:hypothetical protein